MATITASLVKELREMTGAAMMDCKKALVAADGNIEAAIKAMREEGIAKAVKKAGRVAAEGIVFIKVDSNGRAAVMVEVNCETDFVARDTNFKNFVELVAQRALDAKTTDVVTLHSLPILTTSADTIDQARKELINKLGENIQVRRVAIVTASGTIGSYTHGGRIGALVALSVCNAELAKDLAMHVTASNPLVISPKDVSSDLIAKEREIFVAQSASSGKSAAIIEKMVDGRISKFVNEVSLMGQPFIKDPAKTVGDLLVAAQAEVTDFVRFEVGEGIEKHVEDFAEAVRAQISGGSS
jgi:elongation factor Ts